jgi:hypothetical protein
MEYVKQLEAERDALQAQLCKAREIVTLACERLEKLSNQKEIIYGTYLSAIRDILYPESQLFAGEHRPELFCRHAEELTRLHEKLDREKLAQKLWHIDAPRAKYEEWNRFTPRLKEPYLKFADAIIAYLKEAP